MTAIYREEAGYMDLLRDILEHGVETPDRTGVGRRKLFAPVLTFDLQTGFPLFSARSTPLKYGFYEFWAFLNGICDIGLYLSAKGIHIWDAHTSREFLNSRKMWYVPAGYLGKAYGFQLTAFNGEYDYRFQPTGGVNQVRKLAKNLVKDPFSSRHTVTMLNPSQEDEMALHPCWHSHQFLVVPNKNGDLQLNLMVNSRSADTLFGTGFNVSQYALYLTAFAHMLNMKPGELTCSLVDAHLYTNQIEYTKELLTRDFSDAKPTVRIKKPLKDIDDLLAMQWDDIEVIGHELNRAPMLNKKPDIAV